MHNGGIPRIVSISMEEERELLSNLTFSNRQKLIESYIPLVKMIIQKYYASYDEEELLSFGLERLVNCIDKFKYCKQNRLYHYTFASLKDGMLCYLKNESARKENLEVLSEDILDNQNLEQDFIAKETDKDNMKVIMEYLKTYHLEDYKILSMFYELEYDNEKIGKLLNYKDNTISARRARIISRIRLYLGSKGLLEEKYLTEDEKKRLETFKPTFEEVMTEYMLHKDNPSNDLLEVEELLIEEIQEDDLKDITKYLDNTDLNFILNILKSNTYKNIFGELSFYDLAILNLYFGPFKGDYDSINKLALYFNIEKEHIINLIKKVIIIYKRVTFYKVESINYKKNFLTR